MPEARLTAELGLQETLQPERKQVLIEATIAAIAEHGLSNLTLAKVASQAGLTAASVNFHFTSKEGLLLATLRSVAEEFERAVDAALRTAGEDPGETLLAIAQVSLDSRLTEARRVAVWYAFLAESRARADYQRICGERDSAYFEIVLQLCRRLVESAPAGRRPDPEAVAYGLVGLIDQLWQEILFEGEAVDRQAAWRTCRAYLASVFPWRYRQPVEAGGEPAQFAGRLIAPVEENGVLYTLPAWLYHNDEVFALEKERIFLPSWQLVCHVSDLPKAGSFATFELFDERAFVIRGKDDRIRAFHNVCRHRAHSVVQGSLGQCRGVLMCPYHGWTYDYDGSRRGLAAPDTFRQHDRARFALVPIDVEVYLGFVFIRFRSGGPSVAERFAPCAEELERYRTADMVRADGRSFDGRFWEEIVDIDWKNAFENYVEDYHFPTGHGGLSALMDPDYQRDASPTGVIRLSHSMRRQPLPNWSARRYASLLPDYPHLPESMRRRWTYYAMFPNTYFDLFPDMMDFFQVIPLAPGRVKLRGSCYGSADANRLTRAVRYLTGRINKRVQDEDNRLTAEVQKGLRSSSYSLGILSDKESAVHHFQNWVRERLPVARLAEAPPAGTVDRLDRELGAR